MIDVVAAWQQAQPVLKQRVGAHAYDTWFTHISAESRAPGQLFLITPDDFFRNWVVENYLDSVRAVLADHGASNVDISVIIEKRGGSAPPTASAQPTSVQERPKTGAAPSIPPRFMFDNFVVGSSNRMAYAASRAVAENAPGKAYNPLFIFGQSGLGKTHLMKAIVNHVARHAPERSCVYLTSETFTNELISSIQHKSTNTFRQKYRNIDYLLIDDIHFIAGKAGIQEEFFHTFNELHSNHKQIIITSDRPAREIPEMEERLVSRFEWGLTTDIQPPDFETRVAILRKKNELAGVNVSDDIIFFIAENIKLNIRQLEGSLIKVDAFATLQDKPLTLEVAKEVLKDIINEGARIISIEMVQQAVSDHFKLSISDLCSAKKKQTIVLPRQIAMYLIRKKTKHSLPEIGNAFGGRDHTTVLHACKKIEEDIHKSSEIKYCVEKLSTVLQK